MIDISKLFDNYNRQARLYPALLAIFPSVALAAVWLPKFTSTGELVVSLALACGLFFWMADFARARGKKLEKRLLTTWGGWPTTALLRYRDATLSDSVKERYKRYLAKQRQVGALPTLQEEQADPVRADERYAAAITWLKEQCRGKAFPLVEKENATYGFRRNMMGLKPYAISLAIFTALTPCLNLHHNDQGVLKALTEAYGIVPVPALTVIGFTILVTLIWIFGVNAKWVHQAGQQYASALLACCDRPSR